MKVRDLIKALLDCDLDDEAEILLQKGVSVKIHTVHAGDHLGMKHSGVLCAAIEPIDDLKILNFE